MSKSAADICRERGWTAGTRLVSDEGYGPTVIEITAIGEASILAKTIRHNGSPVSAYEAKWELFLRDWKIADPILGHLHRPGVKGPINVEMVGGEQ